MKNSSAGYCKRLYESIQTQYGTEKANEICGEGVAASASAEKRGLWAAETMTRIEAGFSPEEQALVLAGCACGPSQAQMDAANKLWRKCRSLEEYAERRNNELQGAARFEATDDLLYVSYPHCYCSMVKNAANPIPRAWCLCSCEYTRRASAAAFGGPVEVRLLKSSLAGDDECLFEVRIL